MMIRLHAHVRKPTLPLHFIHNACSYFVKPILNYTATVWFPYFEIHELEATQKHVAQFIMYNFHEKSSISGILKNLHSEKLLKLNYVFCCYKIIHIRLKLPLPDYIILAPQETASNL